MSGTDRPTSRIFKSIWFLHEWRTWNDLGCLAACAITKDLVVSVWFGKDTGALGGGSGSGGLVAQIVPRVLFLDDEAGRRKGVCVRASPAPWPCLPEFHLLTTS